MRATSYSRVASPSLLVLSFSDDPTGCGLSGAVDRAPSAAGHQILATLGLPNAVCPSGVYPIRTDCAPSTGAGDGFGDCAEYRRWGAGGREAAIVATGGEIIVQQTWVDTAHADCAVDVTLDFPGGERFTQSFTVFVDVAGEDRESLVGVVRA